MLKITEQQITTIIASLCADSIPFENMWSDMDENEREDFAMSLAANLEVVLS